MTSFENKLKAIFKKHSLEEKPVEEIAVKAFDETVAITLPDGLFNIRKRSLPVGLNKVVGVGFTYEQAIEALQTGLFKTRFDVEKSHWVYYDIEAQDKPETKDVFWNPRPVTLGE